MAIVLLYLPESQLLSLPPFDLRLFVDGVRYALNANVALEKKGLRMLSKFLRTVNHRCRELEMMKSMELKGRIVFMQPVKDMLINQFRLFEDLSSNTNP